jgi:gliding motility-associated-like protein
MNKWGELIYESKDLKSDGWNGKLKSEDVPNGNYVFKIFYTSKSGKNYHKASVFLLER